MLQDAYASQALDRGQYAWFVPPGLCIVLVVLAGFFISRGYEELLFSEAEGRPMSELLEVEDLAVAYRLGERAVQAVDGVALAVPAGTMLGLVGESGCGKTTLARALMGVLPGNGRASPAGASCLDGKDLIDVTDGAAPRAAVARDLLRAANAP